MSLVSLLMGRRTPGKIGNILLDVTISDNHSYRNQVTRFPIENGSDISDHIIGEPDVVTITGFVTDSPVSLLGTAFEIAKGNTSSRKEAAYDELMKLQKGVKNPTTGIITHELVDIVTGLKTYTGMALESTTVPRGKNTREALIFTSVFVQILKVESEITKVPALSPAVNKKARPNTSIGKQTAKKAGTETKKTTSLAKAGYDGFRSLF